MDFKRIVLYAALFLVSISLWNAWEKDTLLTRVTPGVQQTAAAQHANDIPAIPSQAKTTQASTDAPIAKQDQAPAHRLVHVITDEYDIAIDTLGGNVVSAKLLNYPVDVKSPNVPIQLMSDSPGSLYIAQSGLLAKDGPDTAKGQAQFTSDKTEYRLATGQDQLTVNLHWHNKQGLDVTKSFIFTRGKYVVDVNYQIVNNSSKPWNGYLYTQLKRKEVELKSKGLFHIHAYLGGAISSPEKPYEKVTFKDMAKTPLNKEIKGGWAAMLQHYFLSAWVPDSNQNFQYYSKVQSGDVYTLGMIGPSLTVAPGKQLTTGARLYAGPEIHEQLTAVAPHLDLTIDYGFLWFIAVGIFWLMKHIYNIVGNWGWSIVLVTLLIKLVFYKLSAKSYKSMANMRKLQPRIEQLKARFGDDKQKLTQATMELYKKEKMNPLGGCLPIVVQIPVFLALYWVLLESVQLRQAPFIFWIHDLSIKDPFYVLPILMGVTMFLQQRLNPAPPDPIQAKVMMFLPVIFTVLFMSFPAGLVLYWFVNNTLSVLQQWVITRKIEQGSKKKPKTALVAD